MELVRFPSRGGFSVRSVFAFALTVVITALLWVTLSSVPAHAAPEATWRGTDTLLFDNHGYTKAADFKDTTGTIPDGATVYKSPIQPATSGSPDQKVLVLFFSSGVDPPTADSATFVTFTYKNGELSNPQGQQSVSVAPPDESGNSGSSCAVDGIGWIVCPVSTFLADAMDSMFNVLATFIEAKPLVLGDTSNSMYLAWDTMRTIANIAFVIAFLVIIYSQLTNLGVSNYGLKKLIPRLIVAAVLVNVSFYISALAIDLSNILGYSVQDVFNIIREQTFHLTDDNLSGFNTNIWGQVTAAVLAGGGLVGGFYYMAAGGPYLLVSLLIGLLLTLLFVVLILAARQAIIVILVIISPLAFVANLLPNTEKLFDKWKDLFMTMLIFFPAFSLVFGGSQLAGELIIQNAGDNIIMLIFGLAVQVAPLVITPLILKLSGTLLGRIAQIANNPRKGLIDRSRNWGERRAEHAKQQNIARGARLKNPSSWGAGMVRGMDYRRRRLSDKTDIWKQEATNRYEETGKYGEIHARKSESDLNKERIHNQHAEHIEQLKATKGTPLHNASMAVQVSKDSLEARQQETTAYYTQQRTNRATQLGMAAERLEAAKLNTDGWQSNYTAHVESMKLSNASAVGNAARFAQSSKEHVEAAQTRVQTVFDQERATTGTTLNASTVNLERTKIAADGAKSGLTEHITELKGTRGTALHAEVVEAEHRKQTQQISEARLARVVEEYKSGAIDPTTLTAREQTLMRQISEDNAMLSAEKQGAVAAQYETQRNVAEIMTSNTPLTETLLDTAQSVGGDAARVRAQAQAVSTKRRMDSEALGANVDLLKGEAQNAGTTIKKYSAGIVGAVLEGKREDAYGQVITDERLKAALQAQADEKHMALFEKVRGSRHFKQSMVSEIISLNVGTFKGSGGFHMQEDPTLNIEAYPTAEAFEKAMRSSRIQSLANASASGLSGIKFSWLAGLANTDPSKGTTLQDNIDAALSQEDGEKYLRMAYTNVREALTNEDIRATIGDREDEIRNIEAALATVFHQSPTPDDRPSI